MMLSCPSPLPTDLAIGTLGTAPADEPVLLLEHPVAVSPSASATSAAVLRNVIVPAPPLRERQNSRLSGFQCMHGRARPGQRHPVAPVGQPAVDRAVQQQCGEDDSGIGVDD